MNLKTEKRQGLFAQIASRDDALALAKVVSNSFFFVAAIQLLLSILPLYEGLVDALVFAAGGMLVRQFHSRVAAVVLLVLAFGGTCATILHIAGANAIGGMNIFVALIAFGAAVRGVEATFKLHGQFSAAATATK